MTGMTRWLMAAAALTAWIEPAAAGLPMLAPPKEAARAPHDAAVVIGIQSYPMMKGLSADYADGDASAFHAFLLDTVGVPVDRVSRLYNGANASREHILAAVDQRASEVGKDGDGNDGDGTLWIYFAGHGAPGSDREAYLLADDARDDEISIREKSVKRSELVALGKTSRAKRVMIVLDACFSGATRGGKRLAKGMRFPVPLPVKREPKIVVWAAASGAEAAGPLPQAKHGLFTYFVVGALSGWAVDDLGPVTLDGAKRYVETAMGAALNDGRRRQTPKLVGPKGSDKWVLASVTTRTARPNLRALALGRFETEVPPVVPPAPVVPLGPKGFVRIEPGTFVMGSPDDEPGHYYDEARHSVTISRAFWLKATEVTQAEWRAVMHGDPSYFSKCGDDCPVEQVSWFEALEYLNRRSWAEELKPCYRLSACTGGSNRGCAEGELYCDGDFECREVEFVGFECTGYRLPTEAEWEYAARAGTDAALYTGPIEIKGMNNAPALGPIAWYGGNSGVSYAGGHDCSSWSEKQRASSRCGTHPVGRLQPNAWGLYDVLGNVWEWTWDWYGPYPDGAQRDSTDPAGGAYRVLRGGSWFYFARYVRAANRFRFTPTHRYANVGFRPARLAP